MGDSVDQRDETTSLEGVKKSEPSSTPKFYGRHDVAASTSLAAEGSRILVQIPMPGDRSKNRHVALIRHGSKLYGMDATCYHMGGPLLLADIEEVSGFGPCITCPWHHYRIRLENGHTVNQNLKYEWVQNPKQRQRIHHVEEESGRIFVTLDPNSFEGTPEFMECQSDSYAYKKPAPAQRGMHPSERSGAIYRGRGSRVGHSRGQSTNISGAVSASMRGADGVAPWAQRGSKASLNHATRPLPQSRTSLGNRFKVPRCSVSRKWSETEYCSLKVIRTCPAGKNTVQLSIYCSLQQALPFRKAHECNGILEERPYTPYVIPGNTRQFELLVKKYDEGILSPWLFQLQSGDCLNMRGPIGGISPLWLEGVDKLSTFCMIAGGTGITPMLQIITYALNLKVKLRLLFSNTTVEDILLRELLDTLVKKSDGRLSVNNIISVANNWPDNLTGRIKASHINMYLPPTLLEKSKIFCCGSPSFNTYISSLLNEAGYRREDIHLFS